MNLGLTTDQFKQRLKEFGYNEFDLLPKNGEVYQNGEVYRIKEGMFATLMETQ